MNSDPIETCQKCKRDCNPSLIESGECIFCIAKAHRERAEKAEAACAEMRAIITKAWPLYHRYKVVHFQFPPIPQKEYKHALSSDCGKGWMAPEKAQRLREALLDLVGDCCASDFNEHWDCYTAAQQVLDDTK